MKSHQPGDPFALGIGQPKIPAKPLGDPAADLVMAVKAGSPMMIGALKGLPTSCTSAANASTKLGLAGKRRSTSIV